MRVPWPPGFPPLISLCSWGQGSGALLRRDGYDDAKTRADAAAAVRICRSLCTPELLDGLLDLAARAGAEKPVVIPPGLQFGDTGNILARAYGQVIARELDWEFAASVFHTRAFRRDRTTDGWFRLANEREFYGAIEPGRHYVIADDVMTMGGTLAGLRGFIESQGGIVFAMTTLASRSGGSVPIAITEDMRARLDLKFNRGEKGVMLQSVLMEELGYGVDCLTQQEGGFLLRDGSSVDAVRACLRGARHPQG